MVLQGLNPLKRPSRVFLNCDAEGNSVAKGVANSRSWHSPPFGGSCCQKDRECKFTSGYTIKVTASLSNNANCSKELLTEKEWEFEKRKESLFEIYCSFNMGSIQGIVVPVATLPRWLSPAWRQPR